MDFNDELCWPFNNFNTDSDLDSYIEQVPTLFIYENNKRDEKYLKKKQFCKNYRDHLSEIINTTNLEFLNEENISSIYLNMFTIFTESYELYKKEIIDHNTLIIYLVDCIIKLINKKNSKKIKLNKEFKEFTDKLSQIVSNIINEYNL